MALSLTRENVMKIGGLPYSKRAGDLAENAGRTEKI
jgi:hypothetical protein